MLGLSTVERSPYDVEIAIMREMGWSWADYLAAPVDLNEAIAENLQAEAKWMAKKEKYKPEKRKSG